MGSLVFCLDRDEELRMDAGLKGSDRAYKSRYNWEYNQSFYLLLFKVIGKKNNIVLNFE